LYVAEPARAGGRRELRAYAILPDDTLGAFTVLHTFGGDHRGNRGHVHRPRRQHRRLRRMEKKRPRTASCKSFPPPARILESHPVPSDQPMNCAFGDADLASLYVTRPRAELLRASDCGAGGAVKLAAWLMLRGDLAPGNALAQTIPRNPSALSSPRAGRARARDRATDHQAWGQR